MKYFYAYGFFGLLLGLSACKQDAYVLDVYSTMRYDVLALPTAADTMRLTTVDFISAREGFVGAVGGSIFATTDGGQSWVRRTAPHSGTINKLVFTSATAGWAGTSAGLYRTANGGQTWQQVLLYDYYNGAMASVQDIQFVTAQVGYAVGSGGGVYKTSNGGSTWTSLQSRRDKQYTFRSVSFTSPDSGLVVGNEQSRWRTTNGGRTWNFDDYYSGRSNDGYYAVLRYGRGAHLLGTPTGLEAYEPVNAAGGYDLSGKPDESYGYPVYGLACAGTKGPMVGVGQRTLIRRHEGFSQNKYTPWVYVHRPDGSSFSDTYYAADFADASTFYAVGEHGIIHRFHYQ